MPVVTQGWDFLGVAAVQEEVVADRSHSFQTVFSYLVFYIEIYSQPGNLLFIMCRVEVKINFMVWCEIGVQYQLMFLEG